MCWELRFDSLTAPATVMVTNAIIHCVKMGRIVSRVKPSQDTKILDKPIGNHGGWTNLTYNILAFLG